MARPRGKIEVVCQNKKCKYYQKEDGKDIIKKGKNTAGNQKYICLHCNNHLTATKASVTYRGRLSPEKIKDICHLANARLSITEIGRQVGVNRSTVRAWLKKLSKPKTRKLLINLLEKKEEEIESLQKKLGYYEEEAIKPPKQERGYEYIITKEIIRRYLAEIHKELKFGIWKKEGLLCKIQPKAKHLGTVKIKNLKIEDYEKFLVKIIPNKPEGKPTELIPQHRGNL